MLLSATFSVSKLPSTVALPRDVCPGISATNKALNADLTTVATFPAIG